MQATIQKNQTEIKAKIVELRQRFERLIGRCNNFVRISPATVEDYKKEIRQLEEILGD